MSDLSDLDLPDDSEALLSEQEPSEQELSEPNKIPLSSPLLPPDWSYEATVMTIETIINRIELGELELADVFEQFTTAVEQLRHCETFLVRQQHQVDLLIETLLDTPEAS